MSSSAFQLLNRKVQETIWDMGWKELRPAQVQAIRTITETDRHLLICSPTASGKTEAAFLPIISNIVDNGVSGLKSVYVSPLKALINDQFGRLDNLCERMDIPVNRWHGDVSSENKKKFRNKPQGILLITPESIESNFINYGSQIGTIYQGIEFVVIDELHSFLGTERGIHLKSLLSRIFNAIGRFPRMIGLSATISDTDSATEFLLHDSKAVEIIEDRTGGHSVRYFIHAYETNELDPEDIPDEQAQKSVFGDGRTIGGICHDIVRGLTHGTNLLFANKKATLEMLADRLRGERATLGLSIDPFLLHHGSLSKNLREEAEIALKQSRGEPLCVLCSSTLELGIDIGSVRAVGQLGPAPSVSSLVQRLGRSGRKEGQEKIMHVYISLPLLDAKSPMTKRLYPDLLRAIAQTRLMLEHWLEPMDRGKLHLSTLVHQIISCLGETGGNQPKHIFQLLVSKGPFKGISVDDFGEILRSLGKHGIIEQIGTGEIVLAPEGERICRSREFYCAFQTEKEYSVQHGVNEIGKIPVTTVPPVGHRLVLAGRRWRVEDVDHKRCIIFVEPDLGRKAPAFIGRGGEVHTRVVQEMRSLLTDEDVPSYLDSKGKESLAASRKFAETIGLDRKTVLESDTGITWFPWVGTRTLITLFLFAKKNGFEVSSDQLSITFERTPIDTFLDYLRKIVSGELVPMDIAPLVPNSAEKFDQFIPAKILDRAAANGSLDPDGSVEAARRALEDYRPKARSL